MAASALGHSLRMVGGVGLLVAGLLATPPAAHAQSTGATLQGTITDDQSAVMPGATIVITNKETGWTRTVVTDERGWYRVSALPPGSYELRTELSGFASQIRTGLNLTIGQEATVNMIGPVVNGGRKRRPSTRDSNAMFAFLMPSRLRISR